ncbi:MAG: hypothetical protein IT372_33030 [Polyangiaceae bacterium]|nr:hypothetical protein [Polyangiaceae bacterium]
MRLRPVHVIVDASTGDVLDSWEGIQDAAAAGTGKEIVAIGRTYSNALFSDEVREAVEARQRELGVEQFTGRTSDPALR